MNEPPLILVAEPAADGSPPGPKPEPDTGLSGLVMLARFHNIAADAD